MWKVTFWGRERVLLWFVLVWGVSGLHSEFSCFLCLQTGPVLVGVLWRDCSWDTFLFHRHPQFEICLFGMTLQTAKWFPPGSVGSQRECSGQLCSWINKGTCWEENCQLWHHYSYDLPPTYLDSKMAGQTMMLGPMTK